MRFRRRAFHELGTSIASSKPPPSTRGHPPRTVHEMHRFNSFALDPFVHWNPPRNQQVQIPCYDRSPTMTTFPSGSRTHARWLGPHVPTHRMFVDNVAHAVGIHPVLLGSVPGSDPHEPEPRVRRKPKRKDPNEACQGRIRGRTTSHRDEGVVGRPSTCTREGLETKPSRDRVNDPSTAREGKRHER